MPKRRKNSKMYQCDFIGPDGKRVRKSTGFEDYQLASEWEAKHKLNLFKTDRLGHCMVTWQEATVHFLAAKEGMVGAETLAAYKGHFNWLHKYLHGKLLTEIDAKLLTKIKTESNRAKVVKNNFVTDKTRSHATTNRHFATLRCVLNVAHDDLGLQVVPSFKRFMQKEDGRDTEKFLEPDDISNLLRLLRKSTRSPETYNMVRVSLETGLRKSNLQNLNWDQVKFDQQAIIINKKTMKANKTLGIPLGPDCIAILKEQRDKYLALENPDHNLVFFRTGAAAKRWGSAIKDCALRDGAYHHALRELGLEWARWHDLRHAFATWLLLKKTPIEVVQRLGGWSTLKIVNDTYGHLDLEALREHVGNLDMVDTTPTLKVVNS